MDNVIGGKEGNNRGVRLKETTIMISSETYQVPLQEILNKVLISRQITGIDFNLLSLIFLSNFLSMDEKRAIQRVFYALKRGWFQLVDISENEVGAIQSWLQMTAFAKVS
jgi:hypothetical protein